MPASNMIFIQITEEIPASASELAGKLAGMGVKVGVVGQRNFRLVTHYWIDDQAVETTINAFRSVLSY